MNIGQDHYSQIAPFDAHLHVRDGRLTEAVLPMTAAYCKGAVIMPNLNPPILTVEEAAVYQQYLRTVLERHQHRWFQELMAIKITPETTSQIIQDAADSGIKAGKLYPDGVTTNSSGGVDDFLSPDMRRTYAAMQECGMRLLIHGELPGDPDESGLSVLNREQRFLPILRVLAGLYPDLQIVLEHITTAEAVAAVRSLPATVAATITTHHLLLTIDDVIGNDGIQPHHFCKPTAKKWADREALWLAIKSQSPKFFWGSDSAPHIKEKKECACGCAGVFTAPVAMPIMVAEFERRGLLSLLENFTAVYGPRFYCMAEWGTEIYLERRSWTVPKEYDGVVPFGAGRELSWSRPNWV